jgi:LPS-assembly lipoprotein
MKSTRRSWLMALALGAGALAGCGFELRKAPHYSFSTLYSNLPENAPIGAKLRRSLEASNVEVIRDVRQIERAQVIFEQLQELREKIVVGRTATGAIREYQLRLRYRFKLRTLQGIELIPDTEIALVRDINFNETGALSAEAEEGLLYRDMENDLVLQLQRRLAALKSL